MANFLGLSCSFLLTFSFALCAAADDESPYRREYKQIVQQFDEEVTLAVKRRLGAVLVPALIVKRDESLRQLVARKRDDESLTLDDLLAISEACTTLQDHTAALFVARKAVSRFPESERSHRCVLVSLINSGQLAEGEAYLLEAIQYLGDTHDLRDMHGAIHLRADVMNDGDRAITHIERFHEHLMDLVRSDPAHAPPVTLWTDQLVQSYRKYLSVAKGRERLAKKIKELDALLQKPQPTDSHTKDEIEAVPFLTRALAWEARAVILSYFSFDDFSKTLLLWAEDIEAEQTGRGTLNSYMALTAVMTTREAFLIENQRKSVELLEQLEQNAADRKGTLHLAPLRQLRERIATSQ